MKTTDQSLEGTLCTPIFIKRLLLILSALTLILILANVLFIIIFPGVLPGTATILIDVDEEANFATWWNSTLDLLAGMAAFLIAWLVSRQLHVARKRSKVISWSLVGFALVYLAMDDTSQFHDRLAGNIKSLAEALNFGPSLVEQFGWRLWIPLLGIPAIIFMLWMLRFFYKNVWIYRKARVPLLLGVALFLANPAAEVAESAILLSANAPTVQDLAIEHYDAWQQIKLLTMLQEATEMWAVIFFMVGFLYVGEGILADTPAPREDAPDLLPDLSRRTESDA